MSREQKLKEHQEREDFFKLERNFNGIIDVCDQCLSIIDCIGTRE